MNTKAVVIGAVVILVVAVLAVGLTLGGGSEDKDSGFTVTDANGNTVSFDKPAERVVVYSKYVAEAMILMGATDKAVAVTDTIMKDSNYGSYYTNATQISSKPTEGLDILEQLNPDVVISHNTNDNSQLLAHNFKVLEIGASKITEVQNDITALGKVLDMEDKAKKILDWFNPYYEKIQAQKTYSETKYLLESASKTKLTFCNPTSTPGVLLDQVKGTNVFTDTSSTYTYPEGSVILEKNPDVILVVTYNANWNDDYLSQYLETIKSRDGWSQVNAVKNGDVYMVSNDIIGGIRSVIGATFMLSFSDDKYAGVDVSKMVDDYNAIAGTNFNNKMVYS